MNQLKIGFEIDGEMKTFTVQPKITEKLLRETIRFSLKMQNGDILDKMKYIGEFMVYIFNNQFTYEEIIDNMEIEHLFDVSTPIITELDEMIRQWTIKKYGAQKTDFNVIDGGLH